MGQIDKLPFYYDYVHFLEEKAAAGKELAELEDKEKQFGRIKKFCKDIGADYSKNRWLCEMETNISMTNKGENSRLNQLRKIVRRAGIVIDAVEKYDDESLNALVEASGSEIDSNLVRQIMFYAGVCRAGSDPDLIENAGIAIMKRYDPMAVTSFLDEGAHYYILYLQCLQTCLGRYRRTSRYEEVKDKVLDRCMNIKLRLDSYRENLDIGDAVKRILAEVSRTEKLL